MKFCISSRQEKEYLLKADQIKVEYRDRDIIYDYIELYPNKTIILHLPKEEVDLELIKSFSEKIDLICSLDNLYYAYKLKELNIKFFYSYPVSSYFELQGLKELGVCYAYIGMPLFFDLPNVIKIGVPLRAVPNVAYEAYIPRDSGICGQWIRPEDVEIYEKYIDVFEFHTEGLPQERALYRIYAEQKHWPGEMGDIITNFGESDCLNRLVYEDIAQIRISCKQKCQAGHPCDLCRKSVKFGDLVRRYAEAKKEKDLN